MVALETLFNVGPQDIRYRVSRSVAVFLGESAERKAKAEEASYAEIKRACLQLERDFNDDSKWTK